MSSKAKNRVLVAGKKKEIIIIDANTTSDLKAKTCAYVRVSSGSEEQQASYASQFNAYSQMIRDNPDWEFAGVYADEGITGTDAESRPEFKRMIADCKKGKIDRVITKSISRFARNVADLLETVRTLSKIGVSFYFEKESLDTAILDSEMLLIVLASIAESESVSISQNQKFGIQHRMKNGSYIQSSLPYGYEYDKNMQPVTIESQAVVIKEIFGSYLNGKGYASILKKLNKEKVPAPGGKIWYLSRIIYILKNPFYCGDSLWQKKYVTDVLPTKLVKNNGEKEQYLVRDHHPAIIDRESFEKVQRILQSRNILHDQTPHLLSRKLFCPYCNRPLKRRKNADGSGKWLCRSRFENAKNCRLPILSEEYILTTISGLLKRLSEKCDTVLLPLLEDYKEVEGMATNQVEIAEIYAKIMALNEQAIVYAELKLENIIPEEMYQQETAGIQYQIKQLRDQKNKLTGDSAAHHKAESLKKLLDYLTADDFIPEEITEEILAFTHKIEINMNETITIYFKDTLSITGGAEQ